MPKPPKPGMDVQHIHEAPSVTAQQLFLNFDYAGALSLVEAGASAHPVQEMAQAVGMTSLAEQFEDAQEAFFIRRYKANPSAWWEAREKLQETLGLVHKTPRALEGALEEAGYGLALLRPQALSSMC